MISFSPPSTLLGANLGARVSEMRQRIQDVSSEAVTGQRSDLTKHLSGKIGGAMLSQKALGDLSSQRELLSLRSARLDLVQNSLTRVQDSTAGLATRMTSALGFSNDVEQAGVAKDAETAISQVFSALNTRHGDRYLFSGDATATQPFADPSVMLDDIRQIALTSPDAATFKADVDAYFNSPTGGWQQTIYQGTPTASDPSAVTPVDPALTALVSNLAILAIGTPGDSAVIDANPGILSAAASGLSAAESAITNLRADQGVLQKRVSDDLIALDVEESILTQEFSRMAGRDQYEAATELQELEANLEASYLLTARLSNLSLLNFLR